MVAAFLAAVAMAWTPGTYSYRSLANPVSGDQFGFRAAIQQNAQGLSDRLFAALQQVLGGQTPALNFVAAGSPLVGASDLSADAPNNRINVDPTAVEGLTNFNSSIHSPAALDFAHEMAHLRQTIQVLSDLASREGGAQAFADLTMPVAAQRARIPFRPGNYDANYAQYVTQAQQRGNDWILGGQFGHPPVQYP